MSVNEFFEITKETVLVRGEEEFSGVTKVAGIVKHDLDRVFSCDMKLESVSDLKREPARKCIIFGTAFKGGIIDSLIDTGKLTGKREVFSFSLVKNPIPEVEEALVIAGSDKRGTIYGLFTLSELCGVSPFVNWSGIEPEKRDTVKIESTALITSKEPSVKYRGIFINDEWPAFGNWATKRFGGINAACYAEVFELILRMKGNYFWPAMWSSVFSEDGPGLASAELADELGIVMSTSHHEPCMRAGEEYSRLRGKDSIYGDAWDFISNREGIIRFWEDGLKRNGKFENVITMGMRGERDTAIMAEATLAQNIALLKDIIKTQNDLIRKYVNPNLSQVPRQLVLFTEVEKFYYGDENTPGLIDDPELDGITVMFSDNNHGYTRTLPSKKMLSHKGGYGMYYHVDMHGGAMSDEWIGGTHLTRIQDQLLTTYDYGVREIWVVNVGDIVTHELETSLIMDLAYDIDKFKGDNLNAYEPYVRRWIDKNFTDRFDATDKDKIFEIISAYTLMLERRKHEIMNYNVYHPVHFNETANLIKNCDSVMAACDELLRKCDESVKTGFYELVYYPAYGTCNLMKEWCASALNRFYVDQNRNIGNLWNDVIDKCIKTDKKIIRDFHALADGKFYGQGLSKHFGFRDWNDNNCQYPLRLYCYPADGVRLIISKKDESWYMTGREYSNRKAYINDFMDPDVTSFILEMSSAGEEEAVYRLKCDCDWLYLSKKEGKTELTDEITVSIDREKLKGKESATITVTGEEGISAELVVNAQTANYYKKEAGLGKGTFSGPVFAPPRGYIAVEAEYFAEKKDVCEAHYELLKPYGITGCGMKLFPNTCDAMKLGEKPLLDYKVYVPEGGEYEAEFSFAPSTPVSDVLMQAFGVSVNGGDMQTVNTVKDTGRPFHNSPQWAWEVRNNVKRIKCKLTLKKGINTLSYCQLSPNLILERFVIAKDLKKVPESYLGPARSYAFRSE